MNVTAPTLAGRPPGAQRVLALLFVAWLNLALQPCAMALGADPQPDCPHCPPAASDADARHGMHAPADAANPCATAVADCSATDDSSFDSRTGQLKLKDVPGDQLVAILPARVMTSGYRLSAQVSSSRYRRPDPGAACSLNILHCVYLK